MNIEFDFKLSELRKLEERANSIVNLAVAATAVTGTIPVSSIDLPLLIIEQTIMMSKICSVFDIKIEEECLKSLAISAIYTEWPGLFGKTILKSMTKTIPFVGAIIGCTISSAVSGMVTMSMGKAFIEICKMHKLGMLSYEDFFSSQGRNLMKKSFLNNFKKKM